MRHSPNENDEDPFGSYRAEWLRDEIFRLFTEPSYFPELKAPRPCILVGGRGTGKTTVLRCLSYEGRHALNGARNAEIPHWEYYGFYYRVNTNRVTAFQGPEFTEQQWSKLFAHYVNMLLCAEVLKFLRWYRARADQVAILTPYQCRRLAIALRIRNAENIDDLSESLEQGRLEFEAYLNNLEPSQLPPLSLQGQPVDEICAALLENVIFQGKSLFFIIDEYENLLDYQQVVFNTLVKHAVGYAFKIGVRELGWRQHHTLNANEQLVSPADYVLIDISRKWDDASFAKFAADVCNTRLDSLPKVADRLDVADFLPALSIEQEADLLGVKDAIADVPEIASARNSQAFSSVVNSMSELELFFAWQWAAGRGARLESVLNEAKRSRAKWSERYDNYKYAMLFRIRHGKSGIRKYYCGWNTYILLSEKNIRYVLQLVDQARILHSKEGGSLSSPVSFETQTLAAQTVGKKNLTELEGLAVNGAQLTRLLLGLGRIFEVMAKEPAGHAPEVNQFALPDNIRNRCLRPTIFLA